MGKIRDFVESVDPNLKDFKPQYKELELGEVPEYLLLSPTVPLERFTPEGCSKEPDFDGDVFTPVFTPYMKELYSYTLEMFGSRIPNCKKFLVYGSENGIRTFFKGKMADTISEIVLDYSVSENVVYEDISYQFVITKSMFNTVTIVPADYSINKHYRYTRNVTDNIRKDKVTLPTITGYTRYEYKGAEEENEQETEKEDS